MEFSDCQIWGCSYIYIDTSTFFFLPLHGGKVLPNSTPMLLYSTKKKENDGMIVCRDIDTIN